MLGTTIRDKFSCLHPNFHSRQPSTSRAFNDSIFLGEPYQANAEMGELLSVATVLTKNFGHTFNPVIGRLIRLWKVQSNAITPHRPSAAQVAKVDKELCLACHEVDFQENVRWRRICQRHRYR